MRNEINFDIWNEVKKATDHKIILSNLFFREREIWWCSLGMNIGIETNGKHALFERPVLIFKVFNKEMIWVMPITSTVKDSRFYHHFLSNNTENWVNLTQLRTISAKRLRRKISSMNECDYQSIINIILNIIKNETPPK